MIRVLIADDHKIFRQGLSELLSGQRLAQVVGMAADGAETLSKVNALNPDMLILDISMPVMDGFDVVTHLRRQNPNIRILMLSMHNDAISVDRALKLGADGYVLKEEAYDELTHAIAEVSAGRRYVSPLATRSLNAFARKGEVKSLSPREREIVTFIAAGKTTREISEELHISIKTVETHRQRIMEKLNCHKAAELVAIAMKEGLLG